ncbi:MAG: AAA family ATPase [Rhodocyclales bacterium]|nr:AAA family ATPase [Rhodocyclales bacterium]
MTTNGGTSVVAQGAATCTVPVLPQRAPDALEALAGWLVWRFMTDPQDPTKKPRKVPFYARSGNKRSGTQGSPPDREQLVTFAEAIAVAQRGNFDGVGLALLPEWGIVALDFDDCVDAGHVLDEVNALVADTYAETSPSGRGVRAFMRGSLGNNKSRATAERYGFETFSSKGFVTFTGQVLDTCELLGNENTLAAISPDVLDLYEQRFGLPKEPAAVSSDAGQGFSLQRLRDLLQFITPDKYKGYDDWLHVGMALHYEAGGSEAGLDLWDDWSQTVPGYVDRDDLAKRWRDFGKDGGRKITGATLEKLAGTDAAALDFEDCSSPAATTRRKFEILQAADFVAGKPPAWIVRGVLPEAELAVIYGESGSGKSFFAFDLVAAVARGVEWCGRKVRQGRVVYVAAEGAGGFRKRLAAYALYHCIELGALQLGIVAAAPNLLTDDDKALADSIIATGGASIIVIDTLAQATPGANENAGEDMGKVLARCKRLHSATGALILLIHHSGKDATRGARGWSGIRAAVDAEVEITRLADARSARISKQKDGDDGEAFSFRLLSVPLGDDEEGAPVSSCVVEHQGEPPPISREPGGKVQRMVYRCVLDLLALGDDTVSIKAVIDAAAGKLVFDPGKRDKRREHALRSINALVDGGFLVSENGSLALPTFKGASA